MEKSYYLQKFTIKLLNTNVLELMPSFSRTMRGQGLVPSNLWNYKRIIDRNPIIRNLNKQNIDTYIFELIENSNSSHVAGYLYPLFLKCPIIKKDLTSQGSFSMGQALTLYGKCLQDSMDLNNPKEKELYEELLREYDLLIMEKGTPYAFRNNFLKGIRLGINGGFQYDFE